MSSQVPARSRNKRSTIYTFLAVFLSILAVGALVVPTILGFAERVYLDLVNDTNERQARAMTLFLETRLAAGISQDQAIEEFQVATAGGDIDRGYVCLIDQGEARYLSHPDEGQLGMDVKPGAVFEPQGSEGPSPWNGFLRDGASADGQLSYGPQMAQEMVFFTPVNGTRWTVSTHENLSRIETELARLRRGLVLGAVLLSLLLAVPASLAARGVSQREQSQIHRSAKLERRLLEEKEARMSQELDQARELQLSLLPSELPASPQIEFAAHMETATEVGGDYYDLLEKGDGSLILAIGDATGHGLKSSMMVVAVKSLFAYAAEETDLIKGTQRMARALRSMKMGRLHMAFALVRISGRSLSAVGAGMPPALIHRHSQTEGKPQRELEELSLSGAPLGSPMERFPYQEIEVELEPGDTVLLMSDGLPELQTKNGEPLGYQGVQNFFESAARASSSPEDILHALRREISHISVGAPEDDITAVVLRATT